MYSRATGSVRYARRHCTALKRQADPPTGERALPHYTPLHIHRGRVQVMSVAARKSVLVRRFIRRPARDVEAGTARYTRRAQTRQSPDGGPPAMDVSSSKLRSVEIRPPSARAETWNVLRV